MKNSAYRKAGVDIALGNRLKRGLPALLASTARPEVLGKVGGFGGLFALNTRGHRQPVLVASVDGVGTKLKLAFLLNKHDTVGRDLVNHCVNDIAVLGAEPLFFLDYIGTGRLEPRIFQGLIRGLAAGCRENGCALIGGETAQMPGFYADGEYDLCGAIVGIVDKNRLLDGTLIRPGDVVIGVASDGLHTNGYSLARKILLEDLRLPLRAKVPPLKTSLGTELMKVHRSYLPLIRTLLTRRDRRGSRGLVTGLAHITGGGLMDNIPRVLPKSCEAVIDSTAWQAPPIFRLLAEKGKIIPSELYRVFNMGIGLAIMARPAMKDEILAAIQSEGFRGWPIGEIKKGPRRVRLT